MKNIPKRLLDNCIEASRQYWACPACETEERLEVKFNEAKALENAIGIDSISIQNFIDGILAHYGLYPDDENDEIHCALRCLGWMPVDE